MYSTRGPVPQVFFDNSIGWVTCGSIYTDKKENEIFLIYREIQSGPGAKSYLRNGFPIYEEMCKYLTIYEEAVSHI
jgi:hypothetical protein